MQLSLLLAALGVLVGHSLAATLLFSDSPTVSYLRPEGGELKLSGPGLAAATLFLLSVEPPIAVDELVSSEVETLISPDVFKRPQAVLSVHIAGVSTGQDYQAFGSALPAHQVQFDAKQQAASQLLNAIALASSASEPGFTSQALDYTSLPGCSDACIEEALKDALAYLGANYSVQGPPMTGQIQARSGATGSIVLDLQQIPARLWAVELAALHRTVQDVVEEKARREAQSGAADLDRQLLHCTLLGMQALRAEYGADSPQYQAAGQLLVAVLGHAQAQLLTAFKDRLVTQTALLGDAPVTKSGLKGLLAWGEVHRRRGLLQSAGDANVTDSVTFSTSAAAWISGVVMLFFLVTGCYCLSHMQFKQDSLLYPRQKAD